MGADNRHGGRLASASHRTLGEPAVLKESVVQNQSAGHRQIERETSGDAHNMAAVSQHRWRQAGPLRAEHIGSVHRMTKRWQVRCVIQQLYADQNTVQWQAQRVAIGETPKRDVFGLVRSVGQTPRTRIEAGPNHEAECGAEGVGGAQQGTDIGRLGHTFDADAEIAA